MAEYKVTKFALRKDTSSTEVSAASIDHTADGVLIGIEMPTDFIGKTQACIAIDDGQTGTAYNFFYGNTVRFKEEGGTPVQDADGKVGTTGYIIPTDGSSDPITLTFALGRPVEFIIADTTATPDEIAVGIKFFVCKLTIDPVIGFKIISSRGVAGGLGLINKAKLYKTPYVAGGIELKCSKLNVVPLNICFDGTQYGWYLEDRKLKLFSGSNEVSAGTQITAIIDFFDY